MTEEFSVMLSSPKHDLSARDSIMKLHVITAKLSDFVFTTRAEMATVAFQPSMSSGGPMPAEPGPPTNSVPCVQTIVAPSGRKSLQSTLPITQNHAAAQQYSP